MTHDSAPGWHDAGDLLSVMMVAARLRALRGGRPVAPRLAASAVPKVGRNERCPCGSGVKFKRCHG